MSMSPHRTAAPDRALIAFAEALARAQVARDIATLRAARMAPARGAQDGDSNADGHLRPIQQ
ncbi:MAG: hypothetical protein AB7E60_11530 [Sphingobium sp.]